MTELSLRRISPDVFFSSGKDCMVPCIGHVRLYKNMRMCVSFSNVPWKPFQTKAWATCMDGTRRTAGNHFRNISRLQNSRSLTAQELIMIEEGETIGRSWKISAQKYRFSDFNTTCTDTKYCWEKTKWFWPRMSHPLTKGHCRTSRNVTQPESDSLTKS